MIFCSPVFLFAFLPLVLLSHAAAPRSWRNLVLLLWSALFYFWGERLFIGVLLVSIALNYGFGLALDRAVGARRRAAIVAAVAVNLALLGFYKYAGFLTQNLDAALEALNLPGIPVVTPHLPLGISFFTFHALSYVIDVYRREVRARRNPVDFALYLAFFPQLVAGPIVRYHDISDQLDRRRESLDLAASGTERFVAGLGKKMLLANPAGEAADHIFGLAPDDLAPGVAWFGLACYTLQIYLDFSAYSDMAIGLARLFGFNFLENFDYPYCSRSIQEFWRRWHISLSNWLRDYLFIPLGGSRTTPWRVYLNLMIVFFLCGLWHGASWNFVVWGAVHGLFLILERLGLAQLLEHLPAIVGHVYAMSVVMLAWVFFRAPDIGAALHYLAVMAGLQESPAATGIQAFLDPPLLASLAVGVLASTPVFARLTADWRARLTQRRGVVDPPIEQLRIAADGPAMLGLRLVALLAITVAATGRIAAGTYNPFIYFRF